ncbi:MAG TPA: pitrilysin family protein, partial [Terriglobales bacterium]|nr:pitrilysin family protein [Terriglobales bacterium]
MVEELRNIQREVLPNGLTILTERMDHIRSVSMGIWIKSGSRHEDPNVNGISHFVEHMVFKGTTSRTAEDIARQVDSIGGNMDAFTGKETICFNVKVLDEHLPIAVDILSDMVLHPVFDVNEISRERGVILEEIKMDEDNPDYLVHEIFTQNFFKGHPLGKPILGTKETVRRFDQDSIWAYYGGKFSPGNMIISAAGNLKHQEFVELLRQRFESLPAGSNGWHDVPPKINSRIILRNKKALEQVQICVGVPSYPISHDRRYVTYILNTLLGGGMSSRLFQNVREKQGLVYSIFSELNPFRDTGMLSVYAGTSRESAPKVVRSIVNEFCALKKEPISEEELKRAKDQLKGSLMLSLESSTARMSNLARQEMYYDRFVTMDEIIERIQAVSAEDLLQSANELFQPELIAVTVLGNLNGLKVSRDSLVC